MKRPKQSNRRTVLKTIGAGIIGGTVMAGSATASPNGRTDIDLRGHSFTPNRAKVKLGGDGGSATVRWTNDEVNYYGEGFPVIHDVHLHGEDHEGHLVKSGIYTQLSSFMGFDLGPNFYEVEFSEEGSDLVIEEVGGKVASGPKPPFPLVESYDTATIEDWGGSVTLDVHCSIHSKYLDENEGELVTETIEEGEPPYAHHVGFFKMDGGLTVTR